MCLDVLYEHGDGGVIVCLFGFVIWDGMGRGREGYIWGYVGEGIYVYLLMISIGMDLRTNPGELTALANNILLPSHPNNFLPFLPHHTFAIAPQQRQLDHRPRNLRLGEPLLPLPLPAGHP